MLSLGSKSTKSLSESAGAAYSIPPDPLYVAEFKVAFARRLERKGGEVRKKGKGTKGRKPPLNEFLTTA